MPFDIKKIFLIGIKLFIVLLLAGIVAGIINVILGLLLGWIGYGINIVLAILSFAVGITSMGYFTYKWRKWIFK